MDVDVKKSSFNLQLPYMNRATTSTYVSIHHFIIDSRDTSSFCFYVGLDEGFSLVFLYLTAPQM
jgi:hypothetical protein